MRVIVLGSGSTGNALYVESGATGVLVDAGLSARETTRRMNATGIDPSKLSALVITHEHSDHVRGLHVISKSGGVPVFASSATRSECRFPREGDGIVWAEEIRGGQPFQIGDLEFHPFAIPHDGVDTFAYTVSSAGVKMALVTDLGYITKLVAERIKGSDLVIIESNHDRDMLKVGPYPWSVKQRIGGNLGHLSNDETARWLRQDFDGKAEYIVLAHLSRKCNHPELARLSALDALSSHGSLFFRDCESRIKIASPDRAGEWFEF